MFLEGGIPQVAQVYFLATSALDTGSPNHLVLALNDGLALSAQGASFSSVFGMKFLDGTDFNEQDVVGAVQSLYNPGSDQDAIGAAVHTIFNFSDLDVSKNDGFTPDDPFQLVAFSDGQNIGSGTSSQVLTSTPPTAAVPEPASWMMMISGLGGVGGMLRRGREDRRHARWPEARLIAASA